MKLKDAMNKTAERLTQRTLNKMRKRHPEAGETELRERAAVQLGITRQTTFKYAPAKK